MNTDKHYILKILTTVSSNLTELALALRIECSFLILFISHLITHDIPVQSSFLYTLVKWNSPSLSDLDAPKDLEVSETSDTTMVLIWRRPVAKIDAYKLVFVAADGHRAEFEVPDSVSTYILKNLNPGMLYTITLTAERGRKKSAPTSIQASTGQFYTSFTVSFGHCAQYCLMLV